QLVRAGVTQVLALEVDVRAAEVRTKARGRIKGGRGPGERPGMPRGLRLERGVGLGLMPHVFEPLERAHKGLGDVLPAVSPETTVLRVAHLSTSARRTACTNARTLAGSFTRTADSTPLDTSTP